MLSICLTILLACSSHSDALADNDPLNPVLDRMTQADCCRFEFISILESDVFESVDSTTGTALISADDRYDILLGPDRYLRNSEFLYSYSGENEQVTVEQVESSAVPDETIRFITQLDQYYHIQPLSPCKYTLTRKADSGSNLPQIIILTLTESGELDCLEFVDDNGDTNRIVIIASSFQSGCDSAAFVPNFPESTEFIKLY